MEELDAAKKLRLEAVDQHSKAFAVIELEKEDSKVADNGAWACTYDIDMWMISGATHIDIVDLRATVAIGRRIVTKFFNVLNLSLPNELPGFNGFNFCRNNWVKSGSYSLLDL